MDHSGVGKIGSDRLHRRDVRRGGGKEEMRSYRQMLLFQRKLDNIAERHLLQFEKFLGDGAFYTTRRALRLIRAAIEIQRFYSEMKRKGFAFNKGLRVALNYGYYRLLPMKASNDLTPRDQAETHQTSPTVRATRIGI